MRNTAKIEVKLKALKHLKQHIVQQKVQQILQEIVQQKVQQKVHNNYVALLIKQFVLTRLVESLY